MIVYLQRHSDVPVEYGKPMFMVRSRDSGKEPGRDSRKGPVKYANALRDDDDIQSMRNRLLRYRVRGCKRFVP